MQRWVDGSVHHCCLSVSALWFGISLAATGPAVLCPIFAELLLPCNQARDELGAGMPRFALRVLVTDTALLRHALRRGNGLIRAPALRGWLERCVVASLRGGCLTGAGAHLKLGRFSVI